ncbi:MAG: hypothetical protein A2255_02230 [Candidatus Melainabacteria bacterium RIFOXYA2_FULL_32_9]|nr:MAG: hypothetical protein A2255_02230 [Candidatus Melainabacteria bacterium RIFOXYA2_FULL_32_9]
MWVRAYPGNKKCTALINFVIAKIPKESVAIYPFYKLLFRIGKVTTSGDTVTFSKLINLGDKTMIDNLKKWLSHLVMTYTIV